MPDEPDRTELASKIIVSYLRRNPLPADELPTVITAVYQALTGLGKQAEPAKAELTPAVPIRRSYGSDFVVCLDCGWKGRVLRRHIGAAHGLSVLQYRSRWNLPRTHPLIARGYSEYRSNAARQFGLGRRGRDPAEAPTAESPMPAQRRRQRMPSSTSSSS